MINRLGRRIDSSRAPRPLERSGHTASPDHGEQMTESLSAEEIEELARVFRPGPGTTAFLTQSGFPAQHLPASWYTPLEFWTLLNERIAAGILENGRGCVLAMAHRHFPANEVFLESVRSVPPERDFAELGTIGEQDATDAPRRAEARDRAHLRDNFLARLNTEGGSKAIVALIGALGVILAAAVTGWFGLLGGKSSSDTGTSSTSTPANPSIRFSSPHLSLFDNFESDKIDAGKWDLRVPDPKLIYVRDGRLHLEATPRTTPDGIDDQAKLIMRNSGTMTDLSFSMVFLGFKGPSSGGAYAVVVDGRGRQHRVGMGPSSSGEPIIAYWICNDSNRQERCRDYDNYSHPQSSAVDMRRRYNVRIACSANGAVISVNDMTTAITPSGSCPLAGFELHLETDAERSFDVAFDDVRAAYT
jgi:hypothetical protein